MSYLWHSYTGYDRQRIFMEEYVGNKVRTKRYVGNCEYVAKCCIFASSSSLKRFLRHQLGQSFICL